MRIVRVFVSLAISTAALVAQNNPIPTIDAPVYPQAVIPGAGAFALTVRGANFVPGAIVDWNGSTRSTTFVSAGQLQAQILASDVAAPGSAFVTVTNPLPGGGLSSSSYASVEIHEPVSSVVVGQAHTYPSNGGRLFTADLNGDSKPDIVSLNFGVTVLLANGDGTFTRSASLPISAQPLGLSFGDFNNDGKVDFAVVLYDKGDAVVSLGDGTGKFRQLPAFGRFDSPAQTVVGDFNRDGNLDLIVASRSLLTGLGLDILLGNGDGTFQAQQAFTSIFQPYDLSAADFNGDGILDLALVDGGTDLIAVLLGNGDGTFQSPIEMQQGDYVQTLVNDFNGDGKLDFTVVSGTTIGVLLGNGDGSLQPPQFYSTGFEGQSPLFTLGDFTSDGNTDVLTYGETGYLAGFLAGNGDGTMQRVSRFTLPGRMRNKLFACTGDFNSDGLLDFAIAVASGTEVFLQSPQ